MEEKSIDVSRPVVLVHYTKKSLDEHHGLIIGLLRQVHSLFFIMLEVKDLERRYRSAARGVACCEASTAWGGLSPIKG